MLTYPDPFKAEILVFFESVEPVAVAAGYFIDEVTGEQVTDRAELGYIDGDWTWTAGDVYHFERYDLEEYPRQLRLHARRVRRAAKYHNVLVGEWCLGNHAAAPRESDEAGVRAWYRVFADAQLAAWDEAGGSCFWSLRVDSPDHANWSFEQCVERGWICL